ncbi:MAG TPA: hypothetical protein VG992_03215 [Candidatus Saccharimonadales bacterium]|nr:hypothetical protein [Candidatus Saccharimonadales bacterium]
MEPNQNETPASPADATQAVPVTVTPTVDPTPAATPVVVVSGGTDSVAPATSTVSGGAVTSPTPKSRRRLHFTRKTGIITAIAVVLLGGVGYAGYYFAYYHNSSYLWKQSLGDMNKAYNSLVDQLSDQNQVHYKGVVAQGNYSFKSDAFSSDGSFKSQSDGKTGDFTLNVGAGGTRVNLEGRTFIGSNSTSPDLYLKAGGLKGIGDMLGSPSINTVLDKLDNQWIVVDHTFFDNLYKEVGITPGNATPLTKADIIDELKAAGTVNDQYLWSTNSDKRLMKVLKTYGAETVDGHKTFRYKVGFVPDHIKNYIAAQQTALDSSKLGDWLKKQNILNVYDGIFSQMEASASQIKSTDTVDIWADMNTRLLYKARIAEPGNAAENYVDIGLNYTGGDTLPFFISGKGDDGSGNGFTGSLTVAVNTDNDHITLAATAHETGSDGGTFKLNATYQPSNDVVQVAKPTKAMTITQVLDEFGLGGLLEGFGAASSAATSNNIADRANDATRQTDIRSLQTQLEAYFAENGYYPSLADVNSASWRAKNMPSLDASALKDPAGSSQQLASSPAKNVYAYHPTTASGGSCEQDVTACTDYTLIATLSDGSHFKVENLD